MKRDNEQRFLRACIEAGMENDEERELLGLAFAQLGGSEQVQILLQPADLLRWILCAHWDFVGLVQSTKDFSSEERRTYWTEFRQIEGMRTRTNENLCQLAQDWLTRYRQQPAATG